MCFGHDGKVIYEGEAKQIIQGGAEDEVTIFVVKDMNNNLFAYNMFGEQYVW